MNVRMVLLSAGQPFFRDESKFYKWTMAIGTRIYFYKKDQNTHCRVEQMAVKNTNAMEHKL